jgi:hypothetical protein
MAGQEREWSAYDRQQPGLSINGPGSMWKPVRVFNKDAVPMLLTFDTLSAAQAYVAGQTHEISGISTQGAVSNMTVRGRPRGMHHRLIK